MKKLEIFHSSYIANLYSLKLLDNNKTKTVLKILKNYSKKLIDIDISILKKFSNLEIDETKLATKIDIILNKTIKIRSKKNIEKIILKFLDYLKFYEEFILYLHQYWMILELGLENQYKIFVNKIEKSNQFKFFKKYNILIERTKRWSITLLEAVS